MVAIDTMSNEPTGRGRHSLARFALFRSLDDEEIRRLEGECLWRRFEPGSRIIEYEDGCTEVYFIASGVCRMWLPTSRRIDVILADIGAGEFFGELAAIDGQSRSASVTAITAATVACMSAAVFRSAIGRHADVSDQVLRLLAARIRMLNARIAEFSTLSVRDRVRAELLRLGRLRTDQPNQAIISPPPTHTEVAGRISTHREAVTREFSTLERNGLLERRRGALVLCDVAALAELLEKSRAQSELGGGRSELIRTRAP